MYNMQGQQVTQTIAGFKIKPDWFAAEPVIDQSQMSK